VSPSNITVSSDVGSYFQGVVRDALRSQQVEASPGAEMYIVQLLAEFVKPDDDTGAVMDKPVTLLLHDAMSASGSEKFRRLQKLGDGVLYGVGFFGAKLDDSDKRYVLQVGARAYGEASNMLSARTGGKGSVDVLDELAQHFGDFVEVVNDVADSAMAHAARGAQGLVKLYERWLKTGSPLLSNELGQRGIVPTKSAGGVH
jgi:hypothetical protein